MGQCGPSDATMCTPAQPAAGTWAALRVDTTLEAVSAACAKLADRLIEAFGEERGTQLRLGLAEAMTNVVKHGYGGRPGGRMELAIDAGAGRWRFRLRDGGKPIPAERLAAANGSVFEFDPTAIDALPENGMGLSLICMVFDAVEHRARRDGNELTLTAERAR